MPARVRISAKFRAPTTPPTAFLKGLCRKKKKLILHWIHSAGLKWDLRKQKYRRKTSSWKLWRESRAAGKGEQRETCATNTARGNSGKNSNRWLWDEGLCENQAFTHPSAPEGTGQGSHCPPEAPRNPPEPPARCQAVSRDEPTGKICQQHQQFLLSWHLQNLPCRKLRLEVQGVSFMSPNASKLVFIPSRRGKSHRSCQLRGTTHQNNTEQHEWKSCRSFKDKTMTGVTKESWKVDREKGFFHTINTQRSQTCSFWDKFGIN